MKNKEVKKEVDNTPKKAVSGNMTIGTVTGKNKLQKASLVSNIQKEN